MNKEVKKSTAIFIIILIIQFLVSFLKIYYDYQDIETLKSEINHLEYANTTLIEEKNELQSEINDLKSKLKSKENELLKLEYSPEELFNNIKEAYSSLNKFPRLKYAVIEVNAKRLLELYPDSNLNPEAQLIKETAYKLYQEYEKKSNANTTSTYKLNSSYSNSSDVKKEVIVYITDTGTKYHRNSCSYLRQSKIQIDESKAIRQGYTPCSRCNP